MRCQTPVHLQFSESGKFRILAIGDSHEKLEFNEKTEYMLRLLNASAEYLHPDMVVFMGDLVSRENLHENRPATEDEIFEQIVRLTKPFTSRNIPIGIVFGNHDGDPPVEDKKVVFALFNRIPKFINTDESGVTGVGNCFVPIYDHTGEKMLFNLWLLDSGSAAQDGSDGYAWVDDDQIGWYEHTCDAITAENGGVVPSIFFQHIPVCEEYELLRKTSILHPCRVRGMSMYSGSYYTRGDKLQGYLGEGPAVPARNNGQFASWKRKGDVIAAIFGHDHMNDFQGEVDGILLCQTQCSGFTMWGDGLKQGVRVIDLNEADPKSFDTYMVRYRDFFGTKCKSITPYNLLSDRWHINFKITLGVLGAAAVGAAVGTGVHKLKKFLKK